MDDLDGTTSIDAEGRRGRAARAAQDWVKQLVDLTGRNRLLYYRTLKRGTLELTDAEAAGRSTLLSGRTVRLSNLLPVTDEEPNRHDDALKRARTIHGKALMYFEERGIDTLFLAYGMATWTTSSSSATPAAPVLLCPLDLSPRGAAAADFDVALAGDWDVNATLLQLLSSEFDTSIDPDPLLEFLEESGPEVDPTGLFQRLRKEAEDVPDFDIHPRLVAGTFAYTKLPMVRDLEESVDELAEHDLIAAIAGVEEAREAVRELHAPDVEPTLPDFTPPSDEYLILDADASQNHAINATVAGEPLIIQGPPGTGKSQTIANLMATMTARGKRVLFVAEKRAAIDAVTKRLHKVGLDDLVMDLHGGVTSKKEFIGQIAHTLESMGRIPAPDASDLHHRVERNRSALTDYADALHTRRVPWRFSLWEVNERLLALDDEVATEVRFAGTQLEDLDADVARDARDHLREWAGLVKPLVEKRSPWAGAKVTSQDDARHALDLVADLTNETVPSARGELDELIRESGLPAPDSVGGWNQLFVLLRGIGATLTQARPEIWDLDLEELAEALEPGKGGGWKRMVAQLFDGSYRRAKQTLREVWRGQGKPNGQTLHERAAAGRDQGRAWKNLGGEGAPHLPGNLDDAMGTYEDLTDRLAALGAYLVSRDLSQQPHTEIGAEVAGLLSDQQTLFRLPRVHELQEWLAAHHLGPLLEVARKSPRHRERIVESFDYAWLHSIRTQVVSSDHRLASFDGELQSQRVEEYVRADREHLASTPMRVRRTVAEHAVRVRNEHPRQDSVVTAEAKKKRKHLPLRRLFEKAPDVLTALRPCWAMSPLVVSQTLPARQLFDVVIFDEASQVLPADAVPALLRAPQAVVAGDRRQLPPTTFFDAAIEEGDEDEEDDEGVSLTTGFESVLDVLDVMLRDYMLTWHYRSEDERLVAFSNHAIYSGALTTFPGAYAEDCLGFELVPHCPGVKVDTRSNQDEVARVVDLMVDHAHDRPSESLGVIAMGQHHASRIEAALRERIGEERDPDLDSFFDESVEERAFVKNLERVQGDERDAIILSIGYAKQPDGRLLYRFGPLNMQGGERRLNVAVTRARRRLTLVSSFSHTDMGPSRSSAEGVELLRGYLKYVESGGADLGGAEQRRSLNSFELSVKDRLEAAGLKVIPQYGASGYWIDFAVPHPTRPGEMALAIEADGATYHSIPTARDRDRLRQEMLERLGWRFHRIWSTDWFNDPERETEKVLAAYEAALEEGTSTEDRKAQPIRDEGETPAGGTDQVPTRKSSRPPVGPRGPITEYSHSELVSLARWIQSDTLLRTEDQLLDEMMSELGFTRRGKRIVETLIRAIRDA